MTNYLLPYPTSHGRTFTFEGPCIVTAEELSKEITLGEDEACSFMSMWFALEEKFIWIPFGRCSK